MNTNYDLDNRTYTFAKNVRAMCREIKGKFLLKPDILQVIRSSGSVAANYIEGDNALSKKDKIHRFKIVRKEARESLLWLKLIKESESIKELDCLIIEAEELVKIFSSIINKVSR